MNVETVMYYVQGSTEVILLVDELHLEWMVLTRQDQDVKVLSCLGCEHGLRTFDVCVERLRNERFVTA